MIIHEWGFKEMYGGGFAGEECHVEICCDQPDPTPETTRITIRRESGGVLLDMTHKQALALLEPEGVSILGMLKGALDSYKRRRDRPAVALVRDSTDVVLVAVTPIDGT